MPKLLPRRRKRRTISFVRLFHHVAPPRDTFPQNFAQSQLDYALGSNPMSGALRTIGYRKCPVPPNCTFQRHTSWAPTQILPRIPTRPWPAAGTTSATSTPPPRKKPTSFMAPSSAGPIPRTGFTTSAATGQRQRYDSHVGKLPPSHALSS